MYGADTTQLRELAAVFSDAADGLRRASSGLSATVQRTPWRGGDADQFTGRWRSEDRARIENAAAVLEEAALALRRNAEEQDRASGSLRTMEWRGWPEVPLEGGGPWYFDPQFARGIGVFSSIVGVADDTRAIYYATMTGLAGVGMWINESGSSAFSYFRGARGGFTAHYNSLRGTSGAILSGSVNALDYAANVARYGLGSTEAASSAFNGLLSTGASLVPGGGLAYEAGGLIGDALWEHTPLGDAILDSSIAADFEADLEGIWEATDAALAAGDFEEAARLGEISGEMTERMVHETSGYKGLLNATVGVGQGLVNVAADTVSGVFSSLNPFD